MRGLTQAAEPHGYLGVDSGRPRSGIGVGRGRRLQPPHQRRRPLSRKPPERYAVRASILIACLSQRNGPSGSPAAVRARMGLSQGGVPA
jgi:hypothetical protein